MSDNTLKPGPEASVPPIDEHFLMSVSSTLKPREGAKNPARFFKEIVPSTLSVFRTNEPDKREDFDLAYLQACNSTEADYLPLDFAVTYVHRRREQMAVKVAADAFQIADRDNKHLTFAHTDPQAFIMFFRQEALRLIDLQGKALKIGNHPEVTRLTHRIRIMEETYRHYNDIWTNLGESRRAEIIAQQSGYLETPTIPIPA